MEKTKPTKMFEVFKRQFDRDILEITLCVGWMYCDCNNCKFAQLYRDNQDKREFILKIVRRLRSFQKP